MGLQQNDSLADGYRQSEQAAASGPPVGLPELSGRSSAPPLAEPRTPPRQSKDAAGADAAGTPRSASPSKKKSPSKDQAGAKDSGLPSAAGSFGSSSHRFGGRRKRRFGAARFPTPGPGAHEVRSAAPMDCRWMQRSPGYSFSKARLDADEKRTLSKVAARRDYHLMAPPCTFIVGVSIGMNTGCHHQNDSLADGHTPPKAHGQASSMYGAHSPGPATRNM